MTVLALGVRGGSGVPADLAAVYAGEGNTVQAGIDTAKYAGATAASEAFDEPVTDVFAVYAVAKTFFRQ